MLPARSVLSATPARLKSKVIETEFACRDSPITLIFTAQSTYLGKHELTEDQITSPSPAPGKKGDQLPRVPEWTAAFTAQYSYRLPVDGWDGAFRVEGSYTGDSYTGSERQQLGYYRYQDSYCASSMPAPISIMIPMDLDITLFIENIFDKQGDVFISGGNGEPTSKVTNRPQTVGIQVTKGFGR